MIYSRTLIFCTIIWVTLHLFSAISLFNSERFETFLNSLVPTTYEGPLVGYLLGFSPFLQLILVTLKAGILIFLFISFFTFYRKKLVMYVIYFINLALIFYFTLRSLQTLQLMYSWGFTFSVLSQLFFLVILIYSMSPLQKGSF